jgi:hypothetical protein
LNPDRPASFRRAAPMTVCADDFTFCDLVEDALPVAFGDPLADIERLLAEMIELEDHGVLFPAVDARIRLEEFDQKTGPLESHPLPMNGCVSDVSRAVGQVMLTAIGRSTRPTEVVPLPSLLPPPGEFIDRFVFATPATTAQLAHL